MKLKLYLKKKTIYNKKIEKKTKCWKNISFRLTKFEFSFYINQFVVENNKILI